MKKLHRLFIALLATLLVVCSGPRSYRFYHHYNTPQALRFAHQVLKDQGYRIAVFDISSGVIKTERQDFTSADGSTIRHQISLTVVTTDELHIKVLPASTATYRDRIMEPLVTALEAVGIALKHPPPTAR
jgi:sulfur relay (sulfurtransferase) complex TusBCD TusD component (DsrE family)